MNREIKFPQNFFLYGMYTLALYACKKNDYFIVIWRKSRTVFTF